MSTGSPTAATAATDAAAPAPDDALSQSPSEAPGSSDRAAEAREAAASRRAARLANLKPQRPDLPSLRNLDSSIKRNTAVIKKLRQVSEEQRESLLEELKAVNLSKFLSEAVIALCEARLKAADIHAAAQVCVYMHQQYKDFTPALIPSLVKVIIPIGKSGTEDGQADALNTVRKRGALRLLTELYFLGLYDDAAILVAVSKELSSRDIMKSDKDRDLLLGNMTLLVSFARHARPLLKIQPNEAEAETFDDLSITQEQERQLKETLTSFYEDSLSLLLNEHNLLREKDRENERVLLNKGELNEEVTAAYERKRKACEQLFRSVSSLAEALSKEMPALPEDSRTTRIAGGLEANTPGANKDRVLEPIWDDEDSRIFYEDLPDLRVLVPAVLLGDSDPRNTDRDVESIVELKDNVVTTIEEQGDSGTSGDGRSKGKLKDEEKDKEKDKEIEKEGEKEKTKASDAANLDNLLLRLPTCVSRDLIDQLTVEFCYLNSKGARRKLVRALFAVPRTALELLPYYSRMVATLNAYMKDVAPQLLALLEEEFNFLLNKKDQMNVEVRIRNIRFLGELGKFRVAHAGQLFSCLKACLDDFSHHNIEVACALLETSGRFFARLPETSVRMGNMLDIMMRLRNAKNLDVRQSTLVENAYYQCRPPERSARVAKIRPALHQYIRRLLFVELDRTSIERILRQIRKLPWQQCEAYLLKCLMKVHRGKYSQVHLVASLTAGLSRYHDAFSIAVVDQVLAESLRFYGHVGMLLRSTWNHGFLMSFDLLGSRFDAILDHVAICQLLEEVRLGLEVNKYRMQQRRLTAMRFLGELYNYRLVDSGVIFDTLYLILFCGHGTPEQEALDPPEDCFRIRLVIVLLETCGQYFDRGSTKRRLDHFLVYFQRYILSKIGTPLDLEFDLQDLFAELRPKLVRYGTFEEAQQAVSEIEALEAKATANDGAAAATALSQVNGTKTTLTAVEEEGEGDSDSDRESIASLDDEEEGDREDTADRRDEEDDADRDTDEGDDHPPVLDENEDHVKLRQQRARVVDPEEEASFEREMRALMQESLDARKLEPRARPLNMTIPLSLLESSRGNADVGSGLGPDSADGMDGRKDNAMTFRLVFRKGNKQQAKQLKIPKESALAQASRRKSFAKQEAEDAQEKQDIKRRVLAYNERADEDSNRILPAPIQQAMPPSLSRSVDIGEGDAIALGLGNSGPALGPRSGYGSAARQRRPVAAGLGRRR
eukprot:SM000032S12112  [mRNA]  locus=s32:567211:573564:- [translate_table: standard]